MYLRGWRAHDRDISKDGANQQPYLLLACGAVVLAAAVPLVVVDEQAQAAGAASAPVTSAAIVSPQLLPVGGETPVPAPPAPAAPADPAVTPSGWFTPVASYYFSARYGVPGSWSSGHHTGLDFVTRNGAPVRAATDGVVVAARYEGAYGNLLQIKIAPKTEIWMAHLGKFHVQEGERVKAGQVVGTVGMTGRTSGPHCHFEVRIAGKARNPERYFWPNGDATTRTGRYKK